MSVTYHSCGRKPFAPSKRNSTNLCGIVNQGATCYLNTLIQTLFYTPEFRSMCIIIHLTQYFSFFVNFIKSNF